MKKILLTLLCTLAFSGIATSQTVHPKNILGVRAGITISSIQDFRSRVGFTVGVADQIRLSKITPMYFETGLYLSQKGMKEEDVVIRPLYLQIPAVLTYHIFLGKKCSINPFAGFYYGFGIAGKVKNDNYGLLEDVLEEGAFKNVLHRSDLGFRAGATIAISRHLNVGISYESSLINVTKDKMARVMHNKSLIFTVGCNF